MREGQHTKHKAIERLPVADRGGQVRLQGTRSFQQRYGAIQITGEGFNCAQSGQRVPERAIVALFLRQQLVRLRACR
jgi:hypothetical protein